VLVVIAVVVSVAIPTAAAVQLAENRVMADTFPTVLAFAGCSGIGYHCQRVGLVGSQLIAKELLQALIVFS